MLFCFFCQIQKYLDLIKIHSLVYKWFLHCYILVHINPLHVGGHVYKLRRLGSSIFRRNKDKAQK